MISQYQNRVRYAEADAMQIVYHANYYPWFDMGRVDFLKDLGYDYRAMEEGGLLLPLIEGHCRYLRPARIGDEVIIKTRLTLVKPAKLRFEYEVQQKEGLLLVQAYTLHGIVSKELRPINFFKRDAKGYEKLLESREESLFFKE